MDRRSSLFLLEIESRHPQTRICNPRGDAADLLLAADSGNLSLTEAPCGESRIKSNDEGRWEMSDIPSRPAIGEAAALKLRVLFEQADGKLEHWTTANAQDKLRVTQHISSVVYECTPVIHIIGKLSDPAAKHIAEYWPKFVAAWDLQKKGKKGNEAWEIMRNHLRNYVTSLVIHE
jgi:hypothetical protein